MCALDVSSWTLPINQEFLKLHKKLGDKINQMWIEIKLVAVPQIMLL